MDIKVTIDGVELNATISEEEMKKLQNKKYMEEFRDITRNILGIKDKQGLQYDRHDDNIVRTINKLITKMGAIQKIRQRREKNDGFVPNRGKEGWWKHFIGYEGKFVCIGTTSFRQEQNILPYFSGDYKCEQCIKECEAELKIYFDVPNV